MFILTAYTCCIAYTVQYFVILIQALYYQSVDFGMCVCLYVYCN